MKPARDRKCKACGQPFTPSNTLQQVCWNALCAISHSQTLQRRQMRKEKIAGRAKLRTRRDYEKRAQVAFNRFIRLRDANKLCICCDKPLSAGGLTGGGYDAGHYRSTGSAPHLRFVEDNCHAQRKQCNQWGAGRAVDYRLGLIARIGLARVEALEADQTPRKYTAEDLQAIERKYKQMAKDLKAA